MRKWKLQRMTDKEKQVERMLKKEKIKNNKEETQH